MMAILGEGPTGTCPQRRQSTALWSQGTVSRREGGLQTGRTSAISVPVLGPPSERRRDRDHSRGWWEGGLTPTLSRESLSTRLRAASALTPGIQHTCYFLLPSQGGEEWLWNQHQAPAITSQELCDLEQVTLPVWASTSSSIQWS